MFGTPTEEVWPGVTYLPDYSPLFPNWPVRGFQNCVPFADKAGVDLLSVRQVMHVCCVLDITNIVYNVSFAGIASI